MNDLNDVYLDPIPPSKNTLEGVIAEINNKFGIDNQTLPEYHPTDDFDNKTNQNIDITTTNEIVNISELCPAEDENDSKPAKKKKGKKSKSKKPKADIDERKKQLKFFKKSRGRLKMKRIEQLGKLRGMVDFGKQEKCFKCNQMFDMNYLFIYSEDTKPKIENKPYICFWCSLYVSKSEMLRDWDVNPVTPVHCYRCECFRSKNRFLPYEKNCYCIYCSLKKKRVYILENYILKNKKGK